MLDAQIVMKLDVNITDINENQQFWLVIYQLGVDQM